MENYAKFNNPLVGFYGRTQGTEAQAQENVCQQAIDLLLEWERC